MKEVCSNCKFCQEYKNPNDFNDVLEMDLKKYQHNEVRILHLNDLATRFSAAKFVYSKKASEVVSKILDIYLWPFP